MFHMHSVQIVPWPLGRLIVQGTLPFITSAAKRSIWSSAEVSYILPGQGFQGL